MNHKVGGLELDWADPKSSELARLIMVVENLKEYLCHHKSQLLYATHDATRYDPKSNI